MAEVNLEFLGRQLAAVLDGQRKMEAAIGAQKADMAAAKTALAETATRDLILPVLRSVEGRVEVAEPRTQLLRETLKARIKATESRLNTPEAGS